MNHTEEIAIVTKVNPHLIKLVFLQENKTLNLEEVRYGWNLAFEVGSEKKSAILLKTGEWTLLDKEAAQFAFNEMKQWPAVAIVVHNSAQRILGSVGLGIIGQSQKIKVFTDESAALKWLNIKINSQ